MPSAVQRAASPRGPARYGFAPFDSPRLSDAERAQHDLAVWRERERVFFTQHARTDRAAIGEAAQEALCELTRGGRRRLGFAEADSGAPPPRAAGTGAFERASHAKADERSRLGWLHERAASSPALRGRVTRAKEVERARLGMLSERDQITAAAWVDARTGVREGRLRLGAHADGTRASAMSGALDAPRDTTSDAAWAALRAMKADERARLGIVDERDRASGALRAHVETMHANGRGRLGMLDERTRATDAQRAGATAEQARGRARLGMHDERAALADGARARLGAAQFEQRARLGMLDDRADAPCGDLSARGREALAARDFENRARLGMLSDRRPASSGANTPRRRGGAAAAGAQSEPPAAAAGRPSVGMRPKRNNTRGAVCVRV